MKIDFVMFNKTRFGETSMDQSVRSSTYTPEPVQFQNVMATISAWLSGGGLSVGVRGIIVSHRGGGKGKGCGPPLALAGRAGK
jgi:hypothetical protein